MKGFSYGVVSERHVNEWRDLRIEGARSFPLGFIVTAQEMASASLDQLCATLSDGTIRGIFHMEKLVGYCGYRPQLLAQTKHRAEIGPFFIGQHYHGTGAAHAMMNGVINEARKDGIEQLELFVDTENDRAIAFYERFGFERIATHKDGVRIDGVSRDDHFYTLRV